MASGTLGAPHELEFDGAPFHRPAAVSRQPNVVPPAAMSKPDGHSLRGIASWYRWRPGEAAAGPALRAFIGSKWRGMRVRVCASVCIVVRLTDFMRADRLIDLDERSFAALASPSRGLLKVSVARV